MKKAHWKSCRAGSSHVKIPYKIQEKETVNNIERIPSPDYSTKNILNLSDYARNQTKPALQNLTFIGRASMTISNIKKQEGGVTVEASIALVLFLFFFMNLLSFLEMLRLHANVETALLSAGREYAVYGSVSNNPLLAGITGSVYIREQIVSLLGEEYLDNSPLRDGAKGLVVLQESTQEDEFSFCVRYYVAVPFSMTGKIGFWCENHYRGHLWKGFRKDGTDETGSKIYYVTKDSQVYHSRRTCSYIYLTICSIPYSEKNRYRACQLCGKKSYKEEVWVTESGECYHSVITCPALKRTVYAIGESQVAGYRGCSRCVAHP